jgi:hypothetical protein
LSRQLTVSAALSVIAMAVFALFTAHSAQPLDAKGTPAGSVAPALEASLPGF